jgi:hypothetical protein
MKLPETPVGFKRKMTLHINYGLDGGAGFYDVMDPDGKFMPFTYQYDTRKNGKTGFVLNGEVLKWDELRAALGEKKDV